MGVAVTSGASTNRDEQTNQFRTRLPTLLFLTIRTEYTDESQEIVAVRNFHMPNTNNTERDKRQQYCSMAAPSIITCNVLAALGRRSGVERTRAKPTEICQSEASKDLSLVAMRLRRYVRTELRHTTDKTRC
jgi:hypothetical protein